MELPGLTRRSVLFSLMEANSCTAILRKSRTLAGYSPWKLPAEMISPRSAKTIYPTVKNLIHSLQFKFSHRGLPPPNLCNPFYKGYRVISATIHLSPNYLLNKLDRVVHNPMNLRTAPQGIGILDPITKPVALYKTSFPKLSHKKTLDTCNFRRVSVRMQQSP